MEDPRNASSSASSSDDEYLATSEDVLDLEEPVDEDSDAYSPEVLQNLTIEDDDSETKSNPELDLPIKRRFGFN